ncbi:MAG: glutathione S-transferase family protein [Alphaproteobacteria bacterium]|nr:glutathione S-transferase family protein [Alphaproteobacteria bacterium]
MSEFTLYIGDKHISSWSLRPWLALKHTGQAFTERLIRIYQPDTAKELAKLAPAAPKVPMLQHGELKIWDSLAIIEYLNELFPAAQLWPADAAARAVARSVSAEMHSGFQAMRSALSMDLRQRKPTPKMTPALGADVERVRAIWTDCRKRFGTGGPFLFGAFCGADAMYAPVATRFETYGVPLTGEAGDYVQTLLAMPALRAWRA